MALAAERKAERRRVIEAIKSKRNNDLHNYGHGL